MGLGEIFCGRKKLLKRTLAAGLIGSSIVFGSCRLDPPSPPEPPAENELFEHTQILPIEYLNAITSVGEDSIIFGTSVPYSTGDIIVCDISNATPNGLQTGK